MQKNRFLIIIIIFIVLISVVFLFYFSKDEYTENSTKIGGVKEVVIPQHNCRVGNFSQRVNRGEQTKFAVSFEPSEPEKDMNYRVRMGELPRDVIAEIDQDTGKGKGTANINISVAPTVAPASYSLMIVYEEEREENKYIPTRCQFNLIVR